MDLLFYQVGLKATTSQKLCNIIDLQPHQTLNSNPKIFNPKLQYLAHVCNV
jgi:hypothetical protein